MNTKIVIRDFNVLNAKQPIEELENTITQYRQNGYKIASSNIITVNNIKYTIYVILEKD